MKAMIIYFYVAILPLIIHGYPQLLQQLKIMAVTNKSINGIFQPANGGYLGAGFFGLTFKGTLLKPIEREVAMKFTPLEDGDKAQNEYETYTYLGAINNPQVEQYGIPTVYYYGKWKDYILMAITLLDPKYAERLSNHTLKDVDILIVAREFVKISKYIHSRGVHHNDIKLDNLMFLKNKAFIIDFNNAKTLHVKDSDWPLNTSLQDVYEDRSRFAKDDWGCFLYSICVYIGVKFNHFDDCAMCKLLNGNPNISKSKLREEIESIGKIENEKFKRVFVEMAKSVFSGEIDLWAGAGKRNFGYYPDATTATFPNYDYLYRIINEEINKFNLPKPVFVSWLSKEERKKAMEELKGKQLPDISSIKDHFKHIDAEYPKVNYNYFAELDREN